MACVGQGTSAKSDNPGYDQLVQLYREFATWRDAPAVDGFPDYSAQGIEARRRQLQDFQERLQRVSVAGWDRSHEADCFAARSQFDEQDFILTVTRPWARDPVFFVSALRSIAFAELPAKGERLISLQRNLRAIPRLLTQARQSLTEAGADHTALAISYLTQSDGVEDGYPYRKVPPAGVIGWYEDLLARARTQPQLTGDIKAAQRAIGEFHVWLVDNRGRFQGPSGVGAANLDWFLRNVKMIPYDSGQVIALAERELQRLWSFYTLERHRNRNLPELQLPASREEYLSRVAATDARVRRFLVEQDFITIPNYIPADWRVIGFNVPWIERGTPPNFWEQVQYRDPSPDFLHDVVPGHRFDDLVEEHLAHPLRPMHAGDRREGWGVYLEEAALQTGLFDDLPRARELIYVFGIWRAARTVGDVRLLRNEITAAEAVTYWRKWTPWLDEAVARKYAYSGLGRSPGQGLHSTTGAFQMYRLLADRRQQLGERFRLKQFHDEFMARGRIPLALIRYEMTGYDDDLRQLRVRTPIGELSQTGAGR